MLGLYVKVPIACFRKGLAREYLETEPLPPPATCYGFLLALIGEADRRRHIGARACPVLLSKPETSVVLRTVWRIKHKNAPPGSTGNARPDYQQLLSDVRLLVWVDSTAESAGPTLEDRIRSALARPQDVKRFGGLSLGESTHLVDEVVHFEAGHPRFAGLSDVGDAFLLADRGRLTLPVWVDHVGSAGTRYATGDLVRGPLAAPPIDRMPLISPN
jgi:CRISPR-associated protein Cas5t